MSRSQVLQKVNQVVIALMMKKVSVSPQSTLSVMRIRVIPSSSNRITVSVHAGTVQL